MAISSEIIYANIHNAAPFPKGGSWPIVCRAIANGIGAWIVSGPGNVQLSGVTSGVAGSGTVIGTITLSPSVPLIQQSLSAAGVNGPTQPLVATAVALGLASAVSQSAQYTGPSAGVSSGSDVSQVVVANPATLYAHLISAFQSLMPQAVSNVSLCAGLSAGVSAMMLTATGVGTVLPVTPAPSGATGTSPLSVVF